MNLEPSENQYINLKDLLSVIYKRKILTLSSTAIAAALSIIISLSLPNIYTSKSKLVPVTSENSLANNLGGYSSLAGLAGINLPKQNISKSTEAIERIKSYDFFVDVFMPRIKYEDLVAYKNWDKVSNIIIYDEQIFSNEKKWVRNSKPSYQEAFKIYRRILSISEDQQSSFVSIEVEHVSPHIAQEWVALIILSINNHMRDIDKEVAQNSVDYLITTAKQTNITQIKSVISQLIESHIQTLTLAESNKNYIFKPISAPIVPEEKTKPLRAFISIFGTFLGFIACIFYIFIAHITKNKEY